MSDSSALSVEIIPLLTDNYCYLVASLEHKKLMIIDPSEAAPVREVITKKYREFSVEKILLTHHHHDHVGGAAELAKLFNRKVYCSDYDLNRLPFASYGFQTATKPQPQNAQSRLASYRGPDAHHANDDFEFCSEKVEVLYIPGHTLGHVAFYFVKSRFLFCGDTLFSAGCGKLFEGTPQQMFTSLQRLARLPNDTKVYCGHEYTVQNLKFAISVEPESLDIKTYIAAADELRARGLPTIPSTIGVEKAVNPFLRARNADELRNLRVLKDNFT